MKARLRCSHCGAVATLELEGAHAIFDLEDAATRAGWQLRTSEHAGGRVVAVDVCPECASTIPGKGEVTHGGAESPSDPGVGALQNSAPAATGAERKENR